MATILRTELDHKAFLPTNSLSTTSPFPRRPCRRAYGTHLHYIFTSILIDIFIMDIHLAGWSGIDVYRYPPNGERKASSMISTECGVS
jgi:hypothetical protein